MKLHWCQFRGQCGQWWWWWYMYGHSSWGGGGWGWFKSGSLFFIYDILYYLVLPLESCILGIINLNFNEITIGWHIHEGLIEADLMSLCTRVRLVKWGQGDRPKFGISIYPFLTLFGMHYRGDTRQQPPPKNKYGALEGTGFDVWRGREVLFNTGFDVIVWEGSARASKLPLGWNLC
jgi:hypothetical protein